MKTPAATSRLVQAEDAACHVLEAERAALADVELCKHQALQLVAESRVRAEQVHKHNEARIERLRQRAEMAARARQERINGEIAALASDMGTDASVLATLGGAITRITDELAGDSASR